MMDLPREPDAVIAFDIKTLHKQALMLTGAALAAGAALLLLVHGFSSFSASLWGIFLWFLSYTGLIVLHEAFHLLGFIIWGKCRKSDLVFGIDRDLGAAYAGTKKIMPAAAMKKALLLPFWTTGLLPFGLGLFLDLGTLVAAGAFLIGGAAGDFSMYRQLRRQRKDAYVLDHIRRPVLYVYNEKTGLF